MRVAVLGAGIAGTAACLRLLALGVTPLWIAAPEQEEKSGEQLSPAAGPVLRVLEAEHLLHSAHRPEHRVFSCWGSGGLVERPTMLHLEGPPYVLARSRFERDFREMAFKRGLVLRQERVAEVARSPESGFRIVVAEGEEEVSFLFDATGRRSLWARREVSTFRADQQVALVLLLDPDAEANPTPATLTEAVRDGWWYASLLPSGQISLTYFTDSDQLPQGVTQDPGPLRKLLSSSTYVRRWLQENGCCLAAPPTLASAGTTWQAPCVGHGWAAIGDAAAAFDPLSSHGMTTALWTAVAAVEAFHAGDLSAYALKVARGVEEFLRVRAALYGAEQRFRDRPFWVRRQPR